MGRVTLLRRAGAWREQCAQGEEPMWPARLLAAPAPTHGPNIPERWKELGVLPWNGQSESRAWKTKPCGFTCLQSNSCYCRKLHFRNVLSPDKKDLPR